MSRCGRSVAPQRAEALAEIEGLADVGSGRRKAWI